jgi:hypothetical protein
MYRQHTGEGELFCACSDFSRNLDFCLVKAGYFVFFIAFAPNRGKIYSTIWNLLLKSELFCALLMHFGNLDTYLVKAGRFYVFSRFRP